MNENVSLSKSRIKPKEKLVYCSVCLEEIPFSKSIELSCKHRFCLECVTREWEYNIMNGYYSPERLKCPNDACKVPITYFELKSLLKPEVFRRYEDFTIKNFQTNNENPEVAVVCPNIHCQIKSMVQKNYSWFQCNNCSKKYCVECLGDWCKHKGKKCKEFKELDMSPEEVAFREEIKKKKWIQCPVCNNVVEKIEYCNFIRCTSPVCQMKTCFCYLCGVKLNQEDHFNHYVDKNPYGNQCLGSKNTTSNINSKSMGKCPICGEGENCEFQENFKNMVICKSETCMGKVTKGEGSWVCLRCRKYLDERLLNTHLDKPDFECLGQKPSFEICSIF